ncbi:MAG: extracellular solute-binding protein [Micropruina sp.]
MRTAHTVGRRTFVGAVAAAVAIGTAGCSPAQQSAPSPAASGPATTITVRLWDEQVQKAYDASFAEFTKQNPNITVKTVLVPWADYFTKLRNDVSGGNADDIFMMNGSYLHNPT